ncbi:MAG: cytochrome c biogenesis protein CcsA [Bacteroidales bacterium]|nr:cytochrome c biogenesis protein CcsA [Bacteroidales bacterium]
MEKLIQLSGKFSFLFISVILIVLGVATFIEKNTGSDFVNDQIYHSLWFMLLWILTAAFGIIYIVCHGFYHQKPVFLLHCSFVVILLGALMTHLTSFNGYVHLRKGETANTIILPAERSTLQIPFTLYLDEFEIAHYKGTTQPRDYISRVTISDAEKGTEKNETISMNRILDYRGYRFYQSSFDDDHQGSILSVSRDIYGIPITYTGYFLLLLASIWILATPKGRFRTLLRHPLLKGSLVLLLLLTLGSPVKGATLNEGKSTLSEEQAEEFTHLWVQYNGRISPLQTLASDFILKLTGKQNYEGMSAEQFFTGFLFFPDTWNNEPVIKVKTNQLREALGLNDRASFNDFFDIRGNYKLAPYVDQPTQEQENKSFQKEVQQIHEQIQLIWMLQQGYYLNIFPIKENNGKIQWVAPADQMPSSITEKEKKFIQGTFPMYFLCISKNDDKLASDLLSSIASYQQTNGSTSLPSETKRDAELLYNRIYPFKTLFMVNLTVGLILLFTVIFYAVKNRNVDKRVYLAVQTILVLLFLAQTLALLLRTYISGRIPMSNGYETMLIVSWSALLIAMLSIRKGILLTSLGILLSGFTLLVAHIAMLNPQITPLVPVLTSPLLTIHVAILMMAYALAGFMTMNSLIALFIILFAKKETASHTLEYVERLKLLSELFLYPCTLLLGIGIFIGAVWANISWGRYWGWDPKEVWALISFLVYSLSFHRTSLKWFTSTFFFHGYLLFAFSSILMTYFGVNFFLGGMHSYAGEADMSSSFTIIITVFLILISLTILAQRKWKKLTSSVSPQNSIE